jgi:Flp pilus assembly protein TadG
MLKNWLNKRKSERGQSFMELAVSLTFLLILLAAVIDLGWAFYTMVALRDAAQEAAAFGSMCPNDFALIEDRLRESATAPLSIEDIDGGNIEICIIDPDAPPALFACPGTGAAVKKGNSVRVTVRIQHEILTPFVGSFIGTQTYPLTVTVANTILREKPMDECN